MLTTSFIESLNPGVLDLGSAEYSKAGALNELVFGQDITGDGVASKGTSTNTYKENISTTVKQEIKDKYQSKAASDMIAVTTSVADDEGEATKKSVEMFVASGQGKAKANYEFDVKAIQQPSDALMAKIDADTGPQASLKR